MRRALAAAGAFLVLLLAALSRILKMKREAHAAGAEQAEETARRLDHENAAAVRDRARAARRVQPNPSDTRGFRD
jgi:protein-arginine kinase activator protein McsA